jgi:hypothetical protein
MDYELAMETEKILNELSKDSVVYVQVSRLKEIFAPIIENEKEKEFKRKRDIKTSWNKFTPHREISRAINALCSSVSLYEEANKEINRYQKETQDILHALELTDLNDDELFNLMKDLQQIRIYRRLAKNFVESVEPLYKFSCNNKELIKKLNQVHSEVMKINLSIKDRSYNVREKTSLEEAFKSADEMYDRMERLCLLK